MPRFIPHFTSLAVFAVTAAVGGIAAISSSAQQPAPDTRVVPSPSPSMSPCDMEVRWASGVSTKRNVSIPNVPQQLGSAANEALIQARNAATTGSCPAGCVPQATDQENTKSIFTPEPGTNPLDLDYAYQEWANLFDSALKDTCDLAKQDAANTINTLMNEFNNFPCPPAGKPTFGFDFVESQEATIQEECVKVGNQYKAKALVSRVGGCANTNVLFAIQVFAKAGYMCFKQ